MFSVSQAKHQQTLSANNEITSSQVAENKNEDVLEGPIGEVLAQSGSTAVLPCKITDPGAGTVSILYYISCTLNSWNVTLFTCVNRLYTIYLFILMKIICNVKTILLLALYFFHSQIHITHISIL